MALISFFKTPKHRRFQYNPIYYDPQKEELQNRIRTIEDEIKAEKEGMEFERNSTLKRGFLKRSYFPEIKRKKQVSNLRLVIILAALLLVSYVIFFY
jgi:hypothetical protein